MASIINDKETIAKYVRINYINDVSSFPDFQLAADRFLIPIIGQDLYDAMSAEDFADPVLLAKCQAVVAPLAYLIDLPVIQTQITDSGLKTANTDLLQSAHRWEYNQVREHLEDKGSFAIEVLIKHLFATQEGNLLWTESTEYTDLSTLMFTSGRDFNKYFPLLHPHRVWWELRPLIREVEDFYINTSIGDTFFSELKSNDTPSADEKYVISLIKKVIAQITIVKAIEKIAVKITPQGFTIQLSAGNGDASNSGDQAQRDPQLSLMYQSCERAGEAYLLQLIEFLNEKASAQVFATFFTSAKYVKPSVTPAISRNECRKSFLL